MPVPAMPAVPTLVMTAVSSVPYGMPEPDAAESSISRSPAAKPAIEATFTLVAPTADGAASVVAFCTAVPTAVMATSSCAPA